MREYLEDLRKSGLLSISGLDEVDGYQNVQIDCDYLIPNPSVIKVLHQSFKTRNGDACLDVLAQEIEDGNISIKTGGD